MENVAPKNNFYVHQSLANHDPDYDAIYRYGAHPVRARTSLTDRSTVVLPLRGVP